MNRRSFIAAMPGLAVAGAGTAASSRSPLAGSGDFVFPGTYLDAAFTHPFGAVARAAAAGHAEARSHDAAKFWPVDNPRDEAVARFAALIGAKPEDVAVVPSTMEGENRLGAALGLGRAAGVVTDALHYDASLVLYGEARRRGVPVVVVPPRGNVIAVEDIERALTPDTRLIALSLVSSVTGFTHDLARICAMAHARGVLVYADVIQAAGAMPIDVKATGIDFCCAGTYKWLMGDFGAAFLYVRPDRLDRLARMAVGWRQMARGPVEHVLPFDPPGPPLGAYELRSGAAGLFEVSTPAYGTLAIARRTIAHIETLRVQRIAAARAPLIARLQVALPELGFAPLTPRDTPGPIVAFAFRDAKARLATPLADAGLKISLYANRVRISPSVYNDEGDIEKLIDVLRHAVRPSGSG